MEIEDQVVPFTVGERLEDSDSELGGCVGDGQLSGCSLLVGREHDLQGSLPIGQR
jgi:hypothetical protein